MIIEVFQDSVCPWCYIGKKHLQQAITQWQGEPIQIVYRSFQLDPTLPPTGAPFQQLMLAKMGFPKLEKQAKG